MKTITKKQFLQNQKFYIKKIKSGKIFIYPTDTIYGIGCIATDKKSIKKIREIKKRYEKPFSIIIPGKRWIKQNCKINLKHKKYLKYLPGRYTFIIELKNNKTVSTKEIIGDSKKIGIRIPNNWFAKFLMRNKFSFITTSVNYSGEPHITKISQIQDSIKKQVDYIINVGTLNNNPSRIIDLTKKLIKRIR